MSPVLLHLPRNIHELVTVHFTVGNTSGTRGSVLRENAVGRGNSVSGEFAAVSPKSIRVKMGELWCATTMGKACGVQGMLRLLFEHCRRWKGFLNEPDPFGLETWKGLMGM